MPLNRIWLDSRLNELSIESKNTQNGVLTKELCTLQSGKKISNLQQLAATAVAAATTIFCHFWTYYKLNIVSSYIWMDSRLKELSIKFKSTQNRVLTKELCILQSGNKISNLQQLQQQQ